MKYVRTMKKTVSCGTNLQPCVDGECPGSGIHGGHKLYFVNVLDGARLTPVIPVPVINALPQQGVGLYCEVFVNLQVDKKPSECRQSK